MGYAAPIAHQEFGDRHGERSDAQQQRKEEAEAGQEQEERCRGVLAVREPVRQEALASRFDLDQSGLAGRRSILFLLAGLGVLPFLTQAIAAANAKVPACQRPQAAWPLFGLGLLCLLRDVETAAARHYIMLH